MALFGSKSKKKAEDDEEQSQNIVTQVQKMYKDAYDSKESKHSDWNDFYNAYKGDYFKQNLPAYKNQNIENFVFSTIETVKPVMLAENPKIMSLPLSEEVQGKSDAVQKAIDYEWMRTHFIKITQSVITNCLIYGTGILALLWDGKSQNGLGNVLPVSLSPFNFFIDRAATTIEDAEYAGYAMYKSLGELTKAFPEKKEELKDNTVTPSDEWLMHGKENIGDLKNKLLYIEIYFRDYSTELEEVEEEEEDDGGNTTVVTKKVEKMKYPKGRRVIVAGDVLLSDQENPYDDGKFPFINLNCYDIPGEFWGMGEVEQIMSPTNTVNVLTNSIVESAEITSNPIWILDKNCGVAKDSLTNRKGLVVRKNPGTEVRRDSPPTLPAYLQGIIDVLKADIENISGVYDVTRGEKPTGITAAAAIQALNEQAQGRIKLKVQNLEFFLAEVGGMWLSRIQQFWVTKRDVMVMGIDYKPTFYSIDKDDVDGDFDIKIVAGSTMPINKTSKLQQMIQLSQTVAEDGLPCIDRQTILENADIFNMNSVLERFKMINDSKAQQGQQQMQMQMQMDQQRQQFELQKLQMELQAKAQMGLQNIQASNEGAMRKASADKQAELMTYEYQSRKENQNQQNDFIPKKDVSDIISSIPPDTLMAIAESNPRFLDIMNQISNNRNSEIQGSDSQGGIM